MLERAIGERSQQPEGDLRHGEGVGREVERQGRRRRRPGPRWRPRPGSGSRVLRRAAQSAAGPPARPARPRQPAAAGRAETPWPGRNRARSPRPSAAELDVPITAGSASGLRSKPCSAAPARPSMPPIRRREQGARRADLQDDVAGRWDRPGPTRAREHRAGRKAARGRPSARRRRRATITASEDGHQRRAAARSPIVTSTPKDLGFDRFSRAPSRLCPEAGAGIPRRCDQAWKGEPSARSAWPAASLRLPLITCGATAVGAPAPVRPQRIVSLNACADEYLIALADKGQIAALTRFARDPSLSFYADKRRRTYPISQGQAEAVLALHPDLVIASPYRAARTRWRCSRGRVRIFDMASAESFDERGQADPRRSPRPSASPSAARR